MPRPSPLFTNPLLDSKRERSVALRLIRVGFFILIVTIALLFVFQQQRGEIGIAAGNVAIEWWAPLSIAIAFYLFVLVVDLFTPNKKIAAISAVFLGTLTGIVLTIGISFVVDLVIATWVPEKAAFESIKPIMATFKITLGVALCYLCISTVLQTQDQFRLVLPYVEFSKQIRGISPIIIDTSALIDARIVDIAETGLVQSPFIIPNFVLAELQALSDSADRLKRTRGRRGLEVVTRLQRQGKLDLTIDDTPISARAVDQMLVELARRLDGRLMTTDLALARVAQIHGILALNLHDIATAFKPALIPGEQLMIRIIKRGEQVNQGVGYLDDGTMVVAEGGANHIGSEVPMLVTSTMQTTAGRLIFTRVVEPDDDLNIHQSETTAAMSDDDQEPRDQSLSQSSQSESAREASLPTDPSQPPTSPTERKQGPFPPNPPTRRGSSRNPRR